MTTPTEGERAIEAACKAAAPALISNQAMVRSIRAYLAALPGWRLVPVKATGDMLKTADIWPREWRCALQAAPAPPGLDSEGES